MGIFFSKDRSPKKSTSIAPVPEANLDEYKNNIVDNITGKFKNDHSEKIHNFPKLTKALEFIDEVIPISSSFRVLYYDLLDCIKLLTIALESIKKNKTSTRK